MKPVIQIAEMISPYSAKPFFLVETNITSDGPRSRVCDGRWATQEEAHVELGKRMQVETPKD
jgi:hypothetical protein